MDSAGAWARASRPLTRTSATSSGSARFAKIFSRAYFERLLVETGGNQTQAATIAGGDRSYLSKLLSRYRVKR